MTARSAADRTPGTRRASVARAVRTALVVVLVLAAGWDLVQLVVWRQGEDAQQVLASAVAATPDGGTIDLAAAYPLHWDRAAVVGPYSMGRDANDLLGFHAFDDDQILNADDLDSNLVLTDGTRIVAEIDLPTPGYDFGAATELEWTPFAFTPANARFTVSRMGRLATLRPPGT